jgi:hypothetical protein
MLAHAQTPEAPEEEGGGHVELEGVVIQRTSSIQGAK